MSRKDKKTVKELAVDHISNALKYKAVNDVYSYAVEEKVLGERTYHVEVHKNALGNANVEEFIKDITNQTYSHLKSLFRADREELEKKFSFVFEIVD